MSTTTELSPAQKAWETRRARLAAAVEHVDIAAPPPLKSIAQREAEEAARREAAIAAVDRVNAARAEHKLEKAWHAGGEVGPRPATPHLDAINAEYAARVQAGYLASINKGA
jgi:hypothetical protein